MCAVLTVGVVQFLHTPVANSTPPPVFTDADVGVESRVLDAFVDDLNSFDRKNRQLGRKASLLQAEVDSQQRAADDLKRRLSSVEEALRQIARKLKTSGQWDTFDETLLAKVANPKFQDFIRREGFKKTLEDSISSLSSDADQITSPLDNLRRKVQARNPVFGSATSAFAFSVPVAYVPEPVLGKFDLRCRLANLRQGLSGFVHGKPTQAANDAQVCACVPESCMTQ
jgi:chaperonin cofactor prefoldin